MHFINTIIEHMQYLDLFDNVGRIFVKLLNGAQKIAIPASALFFAVGGFYWLSDGDNGKVKAKKVWMGVAIGLAVIYSALSIAEWIKSNIGF
ncbi:TPA: hypothetical protein R1903_002400 [Staphylococcus delphini]|nr:hypothetical protein [Staphylococcus delphini]HEC2169330.1 hypothetical protein [Staphylococcus delphini]HEC2171855.1 hypothetical protein [Staphylococcus delphini]HEC2198624.1 hypothetical protein [Staphylococcus delphini]HEC2201008.1 hypothetical protein [Staphylococcus delphini]